MNKYKNWPIWLCVAIMFITPIIATYLEATKPTEAFAQIRQMEKLTVPEEKVKENCERYYNNAKLDSERANDLNAESSYYRYATTLAVRSGASSLLYQNCIARNNR